MTQRPEPLPPLAWQHRVFPLAAMPKLEWDRSAVAHHEAGHAVVAGAVGLPVHGARIEDGCGGFAMDCRQSLELQSLGDSGSSDTALLMLRAAVARPVALPADNTLDLVTMLQAGRQAEILAAGLPWPGLLMGTDRDTRESLTLLHEQFKCTTALGWCQLRARALLSQRWPDVEEVAAALIEHGKWFQAKTAA